MFDICNDILHYTSWLPGFARASPSLLLPPHVLHLSTLPPSLGLPGFAQNICSVIIAQDNCIPEILFKTWCLVTLTFSPLTPPPSDGVGGGRGLTKNIDFLDSSWNVWHLKFLPIKLPTPGGVGWDYFFVITFLGSSSHFPDFRFFDPLKFPLRPPLVGDG